MCFGCSKEPSHRDGSFEYPQHMFWLRTKKNDFQLSTLIWGPGNLCSYFVFSEGSSTAAVVGRLFGRGKSSLYAGSVASRIIVLVVVST